MGNHLIFNFSRVLNGGAIDLKLVDAVVPFFVRGYKMKKPGVSISKFGPLESRFLEPRTFFSQE